MLHSVEAEMKYQPQSRLYNSRIETPESLSAGPSQTTSGSWLGNLWRRLNRPDQGRPPDFAVRPTTRQGGEKPKGKATRMQSTRVTPSVPLEYAVRTTRPSQRIGSQPRVDSPAAAPRSKHTQVRTERSTPLQPPEYAVRPTRIQNSKNGSKSRMDQRSTRSPLPVEEAPEFSVRGTPRKSRNATDMKPPYYARW